MSTWRLLLCYVSVHRRTPALLCVFGGIFAVVFWAFRLPVQAALYGAAICAVVSLFMGAADFRAFCARHRQLHALIVQIGDGLDGLPMPDGLIEADYQALLRTVFAQKTALVSNSDRERRETQQYYTLWVHQIKTPIAAMDLILQGLDGQEARALRAELFKVEEYVQMVLGYLRSETAGNDFVILRCALDPIIRRALRKYAPMFIRKKLTVRYDGTTQSVLTDEKWLLFLIEQVLSNAIKYTPSGQVRLYLDDQTLVIEDTGIGIAPEDLPRVFEKGFTGYNGREHLKSTGIGLYLSKRVADMLGHSLKIESEPGRGTRVRIGLKSRQLEVE
jgi:signal transduction histidine kinase